MYIIFTPGLEGLDYVERAHEVMSDKLGHHPFMGLCVLTLAEYHDAMLNVDFNSQYNQVILFFFGHNSNSCIYQCTMHYVFSVHCTFVQCTYCSVYNIHV